jgi:hypothetical protein
LKRRLCRVVFNRMRAAYARRPVWMRGHDIRVQRDIQWVLASQRRQCGQRQAVGFGHDGRTGARPPSESGSLTRRRAARTATRSAPVRARRSSGVPQPRRRPHHLDVLHMRPDGVRASAQHSLLVTRRAGGRPHLQRRVVVVATSRPVILLGWRTEASLLPESVGSPRSRVYLYQRALAAGCVFGARR